MISTKEIVMLSTKDITPLFLIGEWDRLYPQTKVRGDEFNSDESYQHLYILSDEKIVDDDWFLDLALMNSEFIIPRQILSNIDRIDKNCRKIIASTDIKLGLPLIHDDFIKIFIDKYNLDTPIKYVNILYDLMYLNKNSYWQPFPDELSKHERKYVLRVYQDKFIEILPVLDKIDADDVYELCKCVLIFIKTIKETIWKMSGGNGLQLNFY